MTNLAHNFAVLEIKSEGNADPIVEVKTALAGLTEDIAKKTAPVADITKRIDELEKKLARPAVHTKAANDNENLEAKALNTFLRNGAAALGADELKTLNIGTPSAGGYAVAPEFSTTIIDKLTQFSPMRSVAAVMSIGTNKVFLPKLATQLAGGWVTETGTRPSSEPAFSQVEIDVYEHAVVVPVSLQLLEDSFVDLGSYIAGQIATQFGKAEATAFVNGDGNGKPLGFLDSTLLAGYSTVTAAQSGTDLVAKLIELHYSLPTAYANNGTWAMNRKTMGLIRAALDTSSKGTLWSDSLANGTPATLMGRPIAEMPDMADFAPAVAADTFPVAFGDFSYGYQIVDRVGVQILRDDFTGADNGVVKIRGRRRVGGKLVNAEAIALLKSDAP
ncbi:phage major capsid protein [Rhizobium leucaenae]|uniref:phage major capsid protein n=1 Tax=Rhizobium leucaenae TaxID=29450 RepID=UPI00162158BE|nr:phage major capsid protein [Rhizobium leucaenae]MBB6299416.1 HK97 family phage major capsid protein [Rhizobium leucaenae]